MDAAAARSWFAEYLAAFAACARGVREAATMTAFFAVPTWVTSDAGAVVLASPEEIATWVHRAHVEPMRAAGYHHSEVLGDDVRVVNAGTVLYTADMVRRDRDGGELGRLTATYLLVDGPRVAVLALHGAAG